MIRVVIADDHKMVREALEFVLSKDKQVDIIALCDDGGAVVEVCRSTHPDIILMDINMHPVNGIEATRTIRTFCPTVKIIGISMHNNYAYVKALMDAGANGYVTKNSGGEEMLNAMHHALEGKAYFCADIDMDRT